MPEIIDTILSMIFPILLILIIAGRILLPVLLRLYVKRAEKKEDTCDLCKGKMLNRGSALYLIPVQFDHVHERSAEYYVKNAIPIVDNTQIPKGNRACRMHVLQCQSCGSREVCVADFLQVRDQEVVQGIDIYPYEKFQNFF